MGYSVRSFVQEPTKVNRILYTLYQLLAIYPIFHWEIIEINGCKATIAGLMRQNGLDFGSRSCPASYGYCVFRTRAEVHLHTGSTFISFIILMLYSWGDKLPDYVDVCPIELPGRMTRFENKIGLQCSLGRAQEEPIRYIPELISQLVDGLLPIFHDIPFAFFGHRYLIFSVCYYLISL